MSDLTVVNDGPTAIHDAHVDSSSGLSLRFGVVAITGRKAFHSNGSLKYMTDDTFTLTWTDEAGTKYSGTVQLPEGFSGNLELVVDPDGKVTSRNGD